MNIDVSRARIGMMVCILAVIVFNIAYILTDNGIVLALLLISAAGVLFFGFFNRCPRCGRGLLRVPLDAIRCPYCGE